ncbi:hypothetical protein PR202_gb01901 [Eleusine coracana subsp. coracana]|uniref:Glycosyltransferase n=1 Tax=Eleusine coracana subsp. coracana TaxID=191504 RepID=A0AAV5DXF6_ELECO|nr:hypothetical protein QOZ80_5BG0413610 [Eleusine coracana subsp. coracana]GJN15016.1 hypothetical protein PR202_gb01901 [Eleusine coracana subsp. coracana]
MKKTVVLYPGLFVSHFVPMLQLADAFLDAGYAVTVALIDPSLKQGIAFGAVVDRVASSNPSIAFHTLPPIPDPPAMTHDPQFIVRYLDLVSRYTQHLHDLLCSMPPGSVHALVVDVVSTDALDAARKLGIPAYIFLPSNASALAMSFQVSSSTRAECQPSFKEMGDAPLHLHGVPPVPASHLFAELLEDPESEVYKTMVHVLGRCGGPESNGILVNTFVSLEARAVGALGDRDCFPGMPPVYCVGPLVAGGSSGGEARGKEHECLAWLDEQPDRSVVFLCFGSVGAGNHSKDQLMEIAAGLEKSGHRFLWVVRASPPPEDEPENKPLFDPRADPDLDALLPDGFLERTTGRGFVVKLWAPQVDVLHHRATGAFVTHCGWNSALEGIMAGVPMICWPLYAEQKMNKVFVVVEEYGVGVEMVGWRDGMVRAKEVEAKVRLVMGESEEGNRIRARVMEHRDAAAVAWEEGGSSRAAFGRFLLVGLQLGAVLSSV